MKEAALDNGQIVEVLSVKDGFATVRSTGRYVDGTDGPTFGTEFDMPVQGLRPWPKPERPRIPSFNENDCGGVFDGYSVSSDADPGL